MVNSNQEKMVKVKRREKWNGEVIVDLKGDHLKREQQKETKRQTMPICQVKSLQHRQAHNLNNKMLRA